MSSTLTITCDWCEEARTFDGYEEFYEEGWLELRTGLDIELDFCCSECLILYIDKEES